jgi:ABC-type multidrug transport system fused ATPase/permease subunit
LPWQPSRGEISFENVRFHYEERQRLFDGVSFTIPGGKVVGLSGPSGVGKTTSVNLILGFYRPQAGELKFDGAPGARLTTESIRENIGVAFQSPYLYGLTILDEIRLAWPTATEEAVVRAAKIACADEFIRELPDGYNTVVGEANARLSHGQRQRICIARAVLRCPRTLILDEATSSLDVATEEEVLRRIRGALPNATIILVSHRISALAFADGRIELRRDERGVIAEEIS